jgi:hypothetical protein
MVATVRNVDGAPPFVDADGTNASTELHESSADTATVAMMYFISVILLDRTIFYVDAIAWFPINFIDATKTKREEIDRGERRRNEVARSLPAKTVTHRLILPVEVEGVCLSLVL